MLRADQDHGGSRAGAFSYVEELSWWCPVSVDEDVGGQISLTFLARSMFATDSRPMQMNTASQLTYARTWRQHGSPVPAVSHISTSVGMPPTKQVVVYSSIAVGSYVCRNQFLARRLCMDSVPDFGNCNLTTADTIPRRHLQQTSNASLLPERLVCQSTETTRMKGE